MSENDRRLELEAKLRDILGSNNVYFQPPNGAQLHYPCIIYKRDGADSVYADDRTYRYTQEYQIMYIDKSPKNNVVERIIEEFSMVRYGRHYVADNLNHDILLLYY